jgi:DNA polymerase-4
LSIFDLEEFAMVANRNLILHLDVDAFFASVEQLLIPVLRNRPVIVGSGCIASCSYEARKFALHAGMSLRKAKRLCPQVEILEGNFQIYRCFAEHIWNVAQRYTASLETHLDEAYGDATGMDRIYGDPLELGRKLRRAVLDEVHLSVSVGLGNNCMIAKIASGQGKPGGVVWIPPDQEEDFLTDLPIEKLPGVGPKTSRRLKDLNINTIGDLRSLDRSVLRSMFAYRGELLYERCRGRDFRPLRAETAPKTISRETTFHRPTTDPHEIRGMLFYLLERAVRTARSAGLLIGCAELTIRYDDFKQLTAARSLPEPGDSEDDLFAVVCELLDRLYQRRVALRYVGVVLSNFVPGAQRRTLFAARKQVRDRELHEAIDAVRDRYGHGAVVTGKSIELLGKLRRNDYGFVLRTPSLTK